MDLNTLLIVLIPSVLSSAVALTSLILNILREKKNKKERIWNTAKDFTLKAVSDPKTAEESTEFFYYVYKYLNQIEKDGDFEKFLKEQREKEQ